MRWLPAARRSSSAPTSKSSRCTRIIGSASGDRREQRDLVAFAQRVLGSDIILIDRDPYHSEIPQRLGISAAAGAQPIEQTRDIANFGRQGHLLLGAADARSQPREIKQPHESTSENGRKSTMLPTASSLAVSSKITSPSERTIEDRIPAPSLGYLTATTASPSRFRLARKYSRRPSFLRYAKPAGTEKRRGGEGAAPASRRTSGRASTT